MKAVKCRAIRDSCVPRDKIFVTSKLSPYEQGSQKAIEAIEKMIATLGAVCELLGRGSANRRIHLLLA